MKRRPNNQTLAEFCEWARKHRTRWFHGCELWTGAKSSGGYGSALFRGRTHLVHRLIAEHYHGPAPEGLPQVNHICHNPACINPAHIYRGTARDNNNDCEAAGRGVHQKGEAHYAAKLTELRVRLLRRLVERGAPVKRLARWFGVNERTAQKAVNRRRWRHV